MRISRAVLAILLFGATTGSAYAQLPNSPAGRRGNALIAALRDGDDASSREFFQNNLAPELFAERTLDEWVDWLRSTKAGMGSIELERANKTGPFSVTLAAIAGATGEQVAIHYEVEDREPHLIKRLEVERSEAIAPMSVEDLPAAADEQLAELTAMGEFSGVVLMARGNEVLFEKAYGLANRRYDVANQVDTAFNLGSINKIFTKVALAQLAAAGKLSFDDTVAQHLPDYPNRQVAERITIQQVVTHTSGLGDIFTEEFDNASKRAFQKPQDYFSLFANDPLLFEPGEGEQYSNGGYIVLGAIVEAVSGQSYHDYIEEHIFAPAGMRGTEPFALDDPEAPIATGYTRMSSDHAGEELRENTLLIPYVGTPAGGGYSTARDLLAFRHALIANQLLDGRYSEWLASNVLPDAAPAEARPFGIGIGGGGPGVNAMLEIGGDWTVVVLSNLDPPAAEDAAARLRQLIKAVDRSQS